MKTTQNEWQKNTGTIPDAALVDVRFKDCVIVYATCPSKWSWEVHGYAAEIESYRICKGK